MITQELVKELFDYNDGKLYRKTSPSGRVKIGDEFGSLDNKGYRRGMINGKTIRAHQIIFLWHHGYLPTMIDHIDRDKSNDRIENLRAIDKTHNIVNSSVRKDSTTGCTGVFYVEKSGRYRAHIHKYGKKYHLGVFSTKEEASAAYLNARAELYPHILP